MRRTTRWCAIAAAAVVAITPATTAMAGTQGGAAAEAAAAQRLAKDQNIPVGSPEDVRTGKFDKLQKVTAKQKAAADKSSSAQRSFAAAATAAAQVGDTKAWLALDDVNGYYVKNYTLMGIGDHIEVWVATDLTFPAGDCRNTVFGAQEVTVTQPQVDSFINEFDTNMYPKESEAFSVPNTRPGTDLAPTFGAPFNEILGVPADYWAGDGDKIVTLVDNVRDANYYDPSTPDGQTYIAGFFSSLYSDTFDRNIMNIDAFDWLHRTGATPPDDTGSPEAASCAAAGVAARPHLYEGVFAHEYQHLLENDQDSDEVSWVNEGLSDWAQTLVGYVNPNLSPTNPRADSHIACFQGFLGEAFGGPENALTLWGDQGAPEILCDYGAAYSFMEYLHGHFGGDAFMSALHSEAGNGLVGLQNVLDQFNAGVQAQDVVHNWLAMMALDHQIDRGAKLKGGSKSVYTTPTLNSFINWQSPQAFSSPGAPPNGGDFVRLRDGGFVTSKQIDKLSFEGVGSYDPDPVEWTVDNGQLYSGLGDNLDRGITTQVTVPSSGDMSLSADLNWGTELGWDFGFVQVYDQTQGKWVSLGNADTTSDHNPAALPNIVANLPGFSGPSPNPDGDPATTEDQSGVQHETFDLSAYAGQTIDIAFRYMTDSGTTGDGFWVDNVAVGGTPVSDGSSLDGWQSLTQAHPITVAGWTVQLVAYGKGKAYVWSLPITQDDSGNFVGSIGRSIRSKVGAHTKVVSAIVTADDPTETAPSYPTYQLTVNNKVQPGGS